MQYVALTSVDHVVHVMDLGTRIGTSCVTKLA